VEPHKREEKVEIADWFRIWLRHRTHSSTGWKVRNTPGIPRQVSEAEAETDRMSAAGTSDFPVRRARSLPPFSLDVQALDLGDGVKAVGLELGKPKIANRCAAKESREIWSAVFLPWWRRTVPGGFFQPHRSLAGVLQSAWNCTARSGGRRCVCCHSRVRSCCAKFSNASKEKPLASGLAGRRRSRYALEATYPSAAGCYQSAYARYTLCAICEPEDGG